MTLFGSQVVGLWFGAYACLTGRDLQKKKHIPEKRHFLEMLTIISQNDLRNGVDKQDSLPINAKHEVPKGSHKFLDLSD